MFRRNHKLKKFAILVAIASIGGIMTACHHSPEKRIDHMSAKIASKLDFNDEQKRLLKEITEDMKTEFNQMKSDRKAKLSDIKSLISASDLDQVHVKKMMEERQSKMNQLFDKYFVKVAALHKTLTNQQKQELIETLEKFESRWNE